MHSVHTDRDATSAATDDISVEPRPLNRAANAYRVLERHQDEQSRTLDWLAQEMGVSRITTRRAVADLKARKLLTTIPASLPGRGESRQIFLLNTGVSTRDSGVSTRDEQRDCEGEHPVSTRDGSWVSGGEHPAPGDMHALSTSSFPIETVERERARARAERNVSLIEQRFNKIIGSKRTLLIASLIENEQGVVSATRTLSDEGRIPSGSSSRCWRAGSIG